MALVREDNQLRTLRQQGIVSVNVNGDRVQYDVNTTKAAARFIRNNTAAHILAGHTRPTTVKMKFGWIK